MINGIFGCEGTLCPARILRDSKFMGNARRTGMTQPSGQRLLDPRAGFTATYHASAVSGMHRDAVALRVSDLTRRE